MAHIHGLNAHERPPDAIRLRYAKFRKLTLPEINVDDSIVDPQALDLDHLPDGVSLSHLIPCEALQPVFREFVQTSKGVPDDALSNKSLPVFTHRSVSGLQIIPSLVPPALQVELLSRLFHRDLSNKEHQTNLHLHYDITYPGQEGESSSVGAHSPSFFEDNPDRLIYPKDPDVHKPTTVEKILNKRLRWVTLGGQYNWTTKEYPPENPPEFPRDVAQLLRGAFPATDAQAAILNVYSTGDTLSVHRDVSEECDVGLISVSFGCDGLFLIGHDDGGGCEIIRLRSGDAVYMDGKSRFAWHGVPKIMPNTCPEWLAPWPCDSSEEASDGRFDAWKGWMAGKRVNLNVRQMTANSSQF